MNALRKIFSANLHKALSVRGIKRVDLSDAIGVPPTTISSWCKGKHLPELDRLMVLCDYLDMPVGELVGDPRHIKSSAKCGIDFELKYSDQLMYIEKLTAENNDLKKLAERLAEDLAKLSPCIDKTATVENYHNGVLIALKDFGAKEVTIKF